MSTTYISFPTFSESDSVEETQRKLVLGVESLEGHSYSLTAYVNECQKRVKDINEFVFEARKQLIALRHKLAQKEKP